MLILRKKGIKFATWKEEDYCILNYLITKQISIKDQYQASKWRPTYQSLATMISKVFRISVAWF